MGERLAGQRRRLRTAGWAVALAFLLGAPGARPQDLSAFLSRLPAPGAWAAYRVETSSPNRVKRERFDLSVTGAETIGGAPYVWLEAGPTNFAGYKDGYLRILIKAEPSKEESLNPFVAALALAYQEPGGEPFELSSGALSFMHSQAKGIRVTQERSELPSSTATTVKGEVLDCTCARITTKTFTHFLGKDYVTTEEGTYWFSPKTPFQLVKAEISRVETKDGKERRRNVLVTLKEGAYSGAASKFSGPVRKEKGLLGLIFH
jgi:hypothetical protein